MSIENICVGNELHKCQISDVGKAQDSCPTRLACHFCNSDRIFSDSSFESFLTVTPRFWVTA